MSWSWTLYRYLAVQFLLAGALVYAIFLMMAVSIDIVDLLNRTAGHNVPTVTAIGMAVLQLPDLGQKMLPFAILLGGVFTFARLSRSQELVATRAAGVSAWDFLLPPLVVAVVIGIFAVTVFTPVSAGYSQNSQAWRRATSRARKASCPCRSTDCGCARATRISSR